MPAVATREAHPLCILKEERQDILLRFLLKFVPCKQSGCWNWTHAKSDRGYGAFQLGGRQVGAHRVAYGLFKGPLLRSDIVCHTCDNPGCVNPNHLYAGTHADNIADREERGRGNRKKGETHGNAKLKEADVLNIRKECLTQNASDIAKKYGVHKVTILDVIAKRTWKHV